MRRRLALAAAVSSSILLLAACGSSGGGSGSGASGGSGGSIPVMVSAGLSAQGTLGRNAAMAVQAVKASAAVINKNGGVQGKQIAVTVVDDKGDPTTAVTQLQNAINSGKKPVVWLDSGPANLAAAVLPILTQNKILSFNIGPTADSPNPAKYPYNFDLSPSTPNYAKAFCPYAKTQGNTKVAILYGDDAYGDSLGPEIKKDCESGGSTVTGIEKFDETSLDLTPQLQKLQSGGPQTLIVVAYGAPVGYVLKGITKIGWNIPVLGDVAVAATDIVSAAPPTGLLGTTEEANLRFEVFQSTVYQASTSQPANLNTMIAALKAQAEIQATLVLAYDYDGVQLFAAAAKKANTTTDVAALAKGIESLGDGDANTGVFERYYFTSSNHSPNEPATAFTFAKPSKVIDGQFDAPNS
jgi:branched-chain amino acid transport system substrate-binding protein